MGYIKKQTNIVSYVIQITEFENEVQNQKEFIEDQKRSICDYRETENQTRINSEITR